MRIPYVYKLKKKKNTNDLVLNALISTNTDTVQIHAQKTKQLTISAGKLYTIH